MKSAMRHLGTLAAVASTAIGSLAAFPAVAANQFGQQEVDQSAFVAVASPYQNGNAHQLLIIEQVSDSRPCWSEESGAPTTVDPLLLQFDFTGICGRSTDSNGYSIRVNGEDMGMDYSLRITRRNGDLVLVGAPRTRNAPEILVGRAGGETSEFAKISLNPGWRFTKRTFGDRTLGHVYLTYEGDVAAIYNTDGSSGGSGTPLPLPPAPVASNFRDANGDIYVAEINDAVAVGFISGFDDGTFRPRESLTREQLVSMVLGAIDSLPNVDLSVPAQVSGNPYTDVSASRWSAAKIQFARDNGIVKGYENGEFRPTQPVTRAELMAVLRRAGEYAKRLQGQSVDLQGNQPVQTFSDTSTHWANDLIGQMSSYCGVASPLNETGNNFAPDSPALRNYAAAATLRTLNCLKGGQQTAAN